VKDEIINRLERIETKLDRVIKAMHDYDGNDEYGESSFEAFMDTRQSPCVAHDAASWDEEEAERRMNIIGQNGNEGLHYGIEENNNKDTQPKQKQYYKNKRSKRSENKK
jgi:hypothetical protein